MNSGGGKAAPDQRKKLEPLAPKPPTSYPGTNPQAASGLTTLQTGAGNAAMAAAATNGSLGTSSNPLSLQQTYGNAAAMRAVQRNEVHVASPYRATESPSTSPTVATETSRIEPTMVRILPEAEIVKPLPKAKTPATPVTVTRLPKITATTAKETSSGGLAAPPTARENRPSPEFSHKVEGKPVVTAAMPATKSSPKESPAEVINIVKPIAAPTEASQETKPTPTKTAQAGTSEAVTGTSATTTPEAVGGEGVATAGVGRGIAGAPGVPGGRQVAGTPSKLSSIDTSSSEGLLQSLASVTASEFGQAIMQAQVSVSEIQAREGKELKADFPQGEIPSGLPRRLEPPMGTVVHLETGTVPDMPSGGGLHTLLMTEHLPAAGLLPGAETSLAADEPVAEENVSWWDWLVGALQGFLNRLPTSDPGVSTDAGPRPRLEATGDADPERMRRYQESSNAQVLSVHNVADAAASRDFGESDIYPTTPVGTVVPTYQLAPPPEARGAAANPLPNLPPEAIAAFDQAAAPFIEQKVSEQSEQFRQEQMHFAEGSEVARAEGQRRLDEATEQARTEQIAIQGQVRVDVGVQRTHWLAENRQVEEEYLTQCSVRRQEVEQQIDDQVRTADEQVEQQFSQAEHRADEERRHTEEEATKLKREAENRPRSFWERVKGGISRVFNQLKSAVNTLFKGLRWLVKQIIEGAKAIAKAVIELARLTIVGLILGFGEIAKGFATIALIAYPERAAEIRAQIDGVVQAGVNGVNAAANWLKEAYEKIYDWIASNLDMLLHYMQTAYTIGLELLRLAVTGDLDVLWRKLTILAGAAWDGLGMVEGEIYRELVGFDLTKELGPQLMAGESQEDGVEALSTAAGGDPANIAFLLQDHIRDDQVEVSPVEELDVDEELLDQLNLEQGQELSLGTIEDPERSSEAIIRELVEPLAEPAISSEPTSTAGVGPVPGSPEQEAASLDPEMSAIVQRAFTAETRAERMGVVFDLVAAGLKKYWRETILPNLWWIIPTIIVAIAAIIALEILTEGAITAALPVILQILVGALLAADIARMSSHMAVYLEKGMAEDRAGAAKAFAKGIAVGIVAVIMLVLFEVIGQALKVVAKAFAQAARAAARGAKAIGKAAVGAIRVGARTLIKGMLYIGNLAVKTARITARIIAKGGRVILERGRLIFPGITKSITNGVKTLRAFFERLKAFFRRFKGFSLEFREGFIFLYAIFNPKVLIALIRDYRGTFFKAFPKLRGKVVVHHSIERQILTRYPGLFSEAELHTLQNLRGIPKAINADIHLSKIRVLWNEFYRTHPTATRAQVFAMRNRIDRIFGKRFLPPI